MNGEQRMPSEWEMWEVDAVRWRWRQRKGPGTRLRGSIGSGTQGAVSACEAQPLLLSSGPLVAPHSSVILISSSVLREGEVVVELHKVCSVCLCRRQWAVSMTGMLGC